MQYGVPHYQQVDEVPLLKQHHEALCKAAQCYERYQLIQEVASQKESAFPAAEHLNALAPY